MVEVVVFAEGQSDEAFLKRVLAPSLREAGVFLKPLTLYTSRHSTGGSINFDRLCLNVRNTLRQNPARYLTTFLDLYALDTAVPGVTASASLQGPRQKAGYIEAALHAALLKAVGFRPERFFAHIQPYELEGLFFAETDALCRSQPGWSAASERLRTVRQAFDTPEHINDGYDTKPSARLESLLVPRYRKTTHAPLIGQQIGLAAIARECPHFAAWVERLRSLQPL